MQISQKLANTSINVAGATLRLDHLCSGTLITGMTGTGKTISIVNPMTAEILKVRANSAPNKPACIYVNAKGEGYKDLIKRLPPSRRKDVIIISPTGNCRLCLFPRNHWPDQDALVAASQDFLLEAARHFSGNDDRHGNHKIYWDGMRDRLLTSAASLHSVNDTVPFKIRDAYFPDSVLSGLVARLQLLTAYVNTMRETPASDPKTDPELVKKLFGISLDTLKLTLDDARKALKERCDDPLGLGADHLTADVVSGILDSLETTQPPEKTRAEEELQTIYQACPAEKKMALNADVGFWRSLSSETWRCVEGEIFSVTQVFESALAHKILAPDLGENSISLEQVIDEGKILIIDCAVTDSANASKHLLLLIQLAFMRTMLARYSLLARDGQRLNQSRSVVFVADEFHSTVSSGRNDGLEVFLSQAREFGCLTILATQNLQLVLSAMGSFPKFSALAALMGTRFFGRNLDTFTNEFAASACGISVASKEHRLGMIFEGCDPVIKNLLKVQTVAVRPAFEAARFCTLAPGQFVCVTQEGNSSFLDARAHLPAPETFPLSNPS
ncbi:hypothetical protein BH09VER1_BH09VER1_47420 [soil metagenome]